MPALTSILEPAPFTPLPVPQAPKPKGTLLIVDDEDGPRQALRVIFKDEYDLLIAPDGPTGIALAQKHRIDVAILDVRMAGMSGIEVLERLKFIDPNIEAVIVTAFETTDTIRQALRLRACDYINKPYELSTIRKAVSSAMKRRSLEGELNNNSEQLNELLRELQHLRMEEQIAHTRGEIYGSIIHDINTPLSVISGFVQLMNQRIGNATRLELDDVEFLKDRLKTITRQVTNCVEISRRYLSFLRKCQPDEASKVGVNQLLIDLEHVARVHPSRSNNDLLIRPLPQDAAVRMNGTDLIQILLNLTTNAFQAGNERLSVEVAGRLLPDALDLGALKDGTNDRVLNIESFANTPPLLMLWVQDTGPGIEPEVLPKIFQPFFTTKGNRQGTGLGLSIVQRLIKEAKGALHLHTEVGRGTRFTVYLPAVALPTAS